MFQRLERIGSQKIEQIGKVWSAAAKITFKTQLKNESNVWHGMIIGMMMTLTWWTLTWHDDDIDMIDIDMAGWWHGMIRHDDDMI